MADVCVEDIKAAAKITDETLENLSADEVGSVLQPKLSELVTALFFSIWVLRVLSFSVQITNDLSCQIQVHIINCNSVFGRITDLPKGLPAFFPIDRHKLLFQRSWGWLSQKSLGSSCASMPLVAGHFLGETNCF